MSEDWEIGQEFETGQFQILGTFNGRKVQVCVADGWENANQIVEGHKTLKIREFIEALLAELVAQGWIDDNNPRNLVHRLKEALK